MAASTIERETKSAVERFKAIDELEHIAGSLRDDQRDQSERLRGVAQQFIANIEPLRATIAATLLGLSERTVRSWVDEGVLLKANVSSKRLLLDPMRVHEVIHLLADLREAGQNRDLIDAVWRRLQDDALLSRQDLQESLGQMRRGITVPARPTQ
jgi:DNA-binding transcriptional MerR regulator